MHPRLHLQGELRREMLKEPELRRRVYDRKKQIRQESRNRDTQSDNPLLRALGVGQ